jgi:RNA polymerase sigma factor (sigma-70 family)
VPSAEEVANALQIDVETLLSMEEALVARAVSSLDGAPTGGSPLAERVAEDDRRLASAENRVALDQALQLLAPRDTEVLHRYFVQEWSQARIAGHFGVSQMQVSRWIASASGSSAARCERRALPAVSAGRAGPPLPATRRSRCPGPR